MQLENHRQPLASRQVFLRRFARYAFLSLGILSVSLAIGVLGYHHVARLSWIDSLLNAAMILTGMGPVNEMTDVTAKVFASVYALYSGVAFLSTVAVLITPVVHRFLHKLHLDLGN